MIADIAPLLTGDRRSRAAAPWRHRTSAVLAPVAAVGATEEKQPH